MITTFSVTKTCPEDPQHLIKCLGASLLCAFLSLMVSSTNANANSVTYTLDNVVLAGCAPGDCSWPPGDVITGTFIWSFITGDFEGGSGVFTSLVIPAPLDSWEPYVQLITQIQPNQIELTGNGNFHDVGLDIAIVFLQDLSPTEPSHVDLINSKFECCGNGFRDQLFSSGTISPVVVPLPAALPFFLSAIVGLGFAGSRRERLSG